MAGGIYKIAQNRWTLTYYIYRHGQQVSLAKSLTKAQLEFIRTSVMLSDRNYFVWEGKKVK